MINLHGEGLLSCPVSQGTGIGIFNSPGRGEIINDRTTIKDFALPFLQQLRWKEKAFFLNTTMTTPSQLGK